MLGRDAVFQIPITESFGPRSWRRGTDSAIVFTLNPVSVSSPASLRSPP
jgi:hypothetical protein